MGGQPKPQLLEIPGAEGASVDYFSNLMNQVLQGQNIPLQQVAGLGANEQTVQNLLSKYLGTSATGGEAYKLGMGELQKTLGGEFYDPRTSDFWKGYRDVSKMEQEEGTAALRRRGQLGGGLFSTGVAREEVKYQAGKEAERTMTLGGLFERERERKVGAVGQALGYAGLEEQGAASRIGLGAEVGAIPRNVLNQQYQAAFNQALGQEQADWTKQLAQIGIQSGAAEQLMPQWYVPGGDGGAGPLGLIGTIASAIIGGK